jgi:ketosteroid isomerase-like protein
MLEGQVAVISSGALSAAEVCDVLDALRSSQLYRADQESYVLYPDRPLPRFIEKNVVNSDGVNQSELLLTLLRDGETSIVQRDVAGNVRFHADFRNVGCLKEELSRLAENSQYASLVEAEQSLVAQIYEQTFRHHRFTGRSENFFAYEGLGSIYWHMVSKLALATLEQYVAVTSQGAADVDPEVVSRLRAHYVAVRDGLGVNKTPAHFGAFPIDPYSHTPAHAGAQQPGMTGQVKEDVLCRMLEIGARVRDGQAEFEPSLFEATEFHQADEMFEFVGLDGSLQRLPLNEGQFGWTWCQVPVVYHRSEKVGLQIASAAGELESRDELRLTADETTRLFGRDGTIARIDVFFNPDSYPGVQQA